MAKLSTIPSERYEAAPSPKSFNSALVGDVPEHFQLIVVQINRRRLSGHVRFPSTLAVLRAATVNCLQNRCTLWKWLSLYGSVPQKDGNEQMAKVAHFRA